MWSGIAWRPVQADAAALFSSTNGFHVAHALSDGAGVHKHVQSCSLRECRGFQMRFGGQPTPV